MPINLGISEYKREHSDKIRVKYFKESMWKAYQDLKGSV